MRKVSNQPINNRNLSEFVPDTLEYVRIFMIDTQNNPLLKVMQKD